MPTETRLYGRDQELPQLPDDDIAVGPSDIVEVANTSLFVFSRAGALLGSTDLNYFMDVASLYYAADPQVIYDPGSGRFYITVTELADSLSYEYDCSQTAPVLIAVSGSSNPLPFTSWLVYALPTGTLTPGFEFAGGMGLGVDSNTIAVTFEDTVCDGPMSGNEVHILQKSELDRGAVLSDEYFVNNSDQRVYEAQPAVELGSASAQYVVTDESDCGDGVTCTPPMPDVEVDTFVGTPDGAGGVTVTTTYVPVAETAVYTQSFTPEAYQPGASAPQLVTDEGRFINAVWESGKLWTAEAVSSIPSGDTVNRSCLNLVEIAADSTGSVAPSLIQQVNNVGINGTYLMYPAVSLDSAGDLFTVFEESSSTIYLSIMSATIVAGGSTLSAFQTLHTSSTYYNGEDLITGQCANGCLFGDSSAVQDPSNPKDVWVSSNAADGIEAGDCGTPNACWETVVSQLTVSAPTISALNPSLGPLSGGQTVTVTGLDFGTDTTATFGGNPITISNLTPTSFTFVTPSAGAGGTDQVQATDALESSTENASSTYTYIGLANYTPLSPYRILDTRTVNAGHALPLGPGEVRPLRVTGLTATPIPPGATAAVLNVTEVSGSASSILTVFPYGTLRPNASNLNFAAHTVIANLVTVTLGANGGQGWIDIYNALGSVNVIVDVEGYFAAPSPSNSPAGRFHPMPPTRVCDTRAKSPTSYCRSHGALGQGASMMINFATTGGIPSDGTAAAVVVNLTAVAGSSFTALSLFPPVNGRCPYGVGTRSPSFSTINLNAGAVQANRAMVSLGPGTSGGLDDAICVYNALGVINVVIDANGWYGSTTATVAGYQFQALPPTRICDTRVSTTSCTPAGSIGANLSRSIPVAGDQDIPAFTSPTTVVAVIANLTAITPTVRTVLILYPANLTQAPTASDLNVEAGAVLPNLAVVQLDTVPADPHDGEVSLYNGAGSVNAVIDIEGWFQ
jgi:hypothetical protein